MQVASQQIQQRSAYFNVRSGSPLLSQTVIKEVMQSSAGDFAKTNLEKELQYLTFLNRARIHLPSLEVTLSMLCLLYLHTKMLLDIYAITLCYIVLHLVQFNRG